MNKAGAKTWYFPDGYLPEKTNAGSMEAHEALMLLNTNSSPANIMLDFYFEDKEPIKSIAVNVGAERVRSLRLDHPQDIGEVKILPW